MALEVGSVYARLGARLDDSGFDRFERRLDGARRDARRDVKTELKGDVDTRGFDRYERRLRDVDKTSDAATRGNSRLRSSFGAVAVGAAAGAVGVGVMARGAFGAVKAFEEAEAISRRTAAAIKSTGGAANVTAKDIESLTDSLSRKSGVDDEAIQSAQNVLLTFTKVRNETGKGNDVFNQGAEAALNMSAALSQDLQGATLQIGKALNDPIKGVTALGRAGVQFTAQQKEQIKTLVDSGDQLGAQRIILSELETQFDGAAEASATASGKMSVAFGNLQEAVGELLAPTFGKAADAVSKFLDEMTRGTGAGGRFVDRVKAVATAVRNAAGDVVNAGRRVVGAIRATVAWFNRSGPAADALATALGALAGVAAVLTVRLIALRIAAAATAAWGILASAVGAVTAAFVALRFAFATNPFGVVLIGLVALGSGLVVLYKRSDTFRRIVTGAFGAVRKAATFMADIILGNVTTILGGFQKMAEVGSKLPIVGGQFKGLADKIKGARADLDGYRESLRKTNDEHDRSPKRVQKLREEVVTLRRRLSTLDKGTEEYRKTAEKLRGKQRTLNDALKDARRPARRAASAIRGVGQAAGSSSDAVGDAAKTIESNVNRLARELGAKGIAFTPARTPRGRQRQSNIFGPDLPGSDDLLSPPGNQRGGFHGRNRGGILPGSGLEDTELVAAAPGEAFLTRFHQQPVEEALALRAALMGGPGSLDELFARDSRPHGSGRAPAFGFQRGGRVNLMGADSRLAGYALSAARYGLAVSSGLRSGGGGSHHDRGDALDLAGAPANMLRFARAAVAKWGRGLAELIYTPLGFGIKNGRRVPPYARADHYDHVHLADTSGGPGGGGLLGLDVSVPAITIDGPAGALRRNARGAVARMRRNANAYLERNASVPTAPGASSEGGLTKGQLAALWRRVNPGLGNPRLMAAIGMAESGGNPAANGPPDGRGLWQVEWPIWRRALGRFGNPFNARANARMAGEILKRQGLGAWVVYNTGAYRQFMQRGGRVQGFQRGGRKRRPPIRGQALRELSGGRATYGRLRALQTDRVEDYDALLAEVEPLQDDYSYYDRLYGMSEEELVDEETGLVNHDAVKKRATELERLLRLRRQIRNRLKKARAIVARVIRTYTTLIKRLSDAKKAVTGKRGFKRQRRAYYDGLIKTYRERRAEWKEKVPEARTAYRDSFLDVKETELELAGVRGTRPTAGDAEPADEPDLGGASDLGDTATTPDTPAATTPDPAAVAAEAIAEAGRFQANRATLFAGHGANFLGRGSGPLGGVGEAAGLRYYGAGTGGSDGGVLRAGGAVIEQNITLTGPQPVDPHIFTQIALHELKAAL